MTETKDMLDVPLPGCDQALQFRRIPAGLFRMGERGGDPADEPAHRVRIEEDFYLGVFPVTQAQFAVWTGSEAYREWFREHESRIRETSMDGIAEPHRNHFNEPRRPRHPAEQVTWWEARGYAQWLTAQGGLPAGWRADLPGEAQWEYACRGGTETRYWSGDREEDLARVGWYGANAGGETHEVGSKGEAAANAFGLHDLHGNVWEWCLDFYDARRYRKGVEGEPALPLLRKDRVEPSVANPKYVTLAALMARIVADPVNGRAIRDPQELEALRWLKGVAEGVVRGGDSSWQPVLDQVVPALIKEEWPGGEIDVAKKLGATLREWAHRVSSVEKPPRVLRGGAWSNAAAVCRAARRVRDSPGQRNWYGGFRLALARGAEFTEDATKRSDGGGGLENGDMSTTIDGGGTTALSSADGVAWWKSKVPFPFPARPDPTVRRLVLGNLEDDKALPLKPEVLAGLARIGTHFPNLTHLHLWGLANLETVDGLPEGLEALDVRKCPTLTRVGAVGASLRSLDLGGCERLTELPRGPFGGLERVWLDGCKALERFQPLLSALVSLQRLELHGCRFKDLDGALCGEAGGNVAAEVRAHFAALKAQGTAVLAECKIVVLGDGGVGKTELVRALKGLPFDAGQKSTDGIRLWKWKGGTEDGREPDFAPFPKEGVKSVDLNVWDFGGQDLYHNTHRLFLENRAVFVVVWREPRRKDGQMLPWRPEHKEDPMRPLNYWLDQVRAFNPGAEIVVVRTGMDEDAQWPPGDWQAQVREEYRGLRHFEVSAKDRGLGDLEGLRAHLLELVQSELGGAEAVNMPRGRVAVRRALSDLQPDWDGVGEAVASARPVLRRHEYAALARAVFAKLPPEGPGKKGLAEPDDAEIGWQLNYFHHAGALYAPPRWMEEAPSRDAQPVIVDQRWVIDGIYRSFLLDNPGRGFLESVNGCLNVEALDEAWDEVLAADGKPRYDELARWVMLRYMRQCGLVRKREGEWIFPEFLRDRKALYAAGGLREDEWIRSTRPASDARVYRVRHRSLGQGFGCLLVGRMAEKFEKMPLFKYGGIGRVKVEAGSEDKTDKAGKGIPCLFRVEWCRRSAGDFQGDIEATLFGPQEDDGDVLAFLEDVLRGIPGFPPEARFEAREGGSVASLSGPGFEMFQPGSLPGARPSRAVAQPVLGYVGLSMAGNDAANPDVEFWPRAILRGLDRIRDRPYGVVAYKRDVERTTMGELVGDLARSDLLVAVIGRKYLSSEYCMAEFLAAVDERWGRGALDKPEDWLERLWPVMLADALALQGGSTETKGGGEEAVGSWKRGWRKRGLAYLHDVNTEFETVANARSQAPAHYVEDSWMRFVAEEDRHLGLILSALRADRLNRRFPEPETRLQGEALKRWADGLVASLVDGIHQRMRKILGGLEPEERFGRAFRECLRNGKRDKKDEAADAFDALLEACPDPAQARKDAFAGKLPDGVGKPEELEKVRKKWAERQGPSG